MNRFCGTFFSMAHATKIENCNRCATKQEHQKNISIAKVNVKYMQHLKQPRFSKKEANKMSSEREKKMLHNSVSEQNEMNAREYKKQLTEWRMVQAHQNEQWKAKCGVRVKERKKNSRLELIMVNGKLCKHNIRHNTTFVWAIWFFLLLLLLLFPHHRLFLLGYIKYFISMLVSCNKKQNAITKKYVHLQ